jgi:hypothetical protein
MSYSIGELVVVLEVPADHSVSGIEFGTWLGGFCPVLSGTITTVNRTVVTLLR